MREGDMGVFGTEPEVMNEIDDAKASDAQLTPEEKAQLRGRSEQLIKKARLINVRRDQCRLVLQDKFGEEVANVFLERAQVAAMIDLTRDKETAEKLQGIYTELGWNTEQIHQLAELNPEEGLRTEDSIIAPAAEEWNHVEGYPAHAPGISQRHIFQYRSIDDAHGIIVFHRANEVIDGAFQYTPVYQDKHYATQKEVEQLSELVELWYAKLTERYTKLELGAPGTGQGDDQA